MYYILNVYIFFFVLAERVNKFIPY